MSRPIEESAPAAGTTSAAPARTTLLMVDDEETFRRLTARELERAGYTVIEAHALATRTLDSPAPREALEKLVLLTQSGSASAP